MKPVHVIVLVLVAVAAGGVWFLLQGDGTPRSVATTGVADPRSAPAAPGAATSPVRADVADPRAGGTRVSDPTAAAARAVQDALDAAPLVPVLRGSVVDAAGAPVAGATVLVSTNRNRTQYALDSALFQGRGKWRVTSAETDAEGRFSLSGPKPGPLRLAVRADGFAPYDNDDLDLPAEEEVELGTVVLEPGVELAGRVLGPDLRPVPDAAILSVPLVRDFSMGAAAREVAAPVATTDAEGRFRIGGLAPGPWKLLVSSEEHPDQMEEGVAGDRREVEIRLAAGLSIGGEVVGERDAPLVVRATPTGVQRVAPGGSSPEYREVPVDERGRFELRGLAGEWPYRLRVRAAADRGMQPRWLAVPVESRAGESGVRLVLKPGGDLVFVVLDASTGQPLDEFAVAVTARLADQSWRREFATDDEELERDAATGRVRLRSLQGTGTDARTSVLVRAPGYTIEQRTDLVLQPGGELNLGVFSLTPLPQALARVTAAATGEPVHHAIVHLTSFEDDDVASTEGSRAPTRTSASTDASGEALIAGPPGRRVFVWATHPSYAPTEPASFVLPISGRPEVELRLSAGATVAAVVKDGGGKPLAGRTVRRNEFRPELDGGSWQAAGGTGRVVTDAEGRAVFEHLRPGRHRFSVMLPPGTFGAEPLWAETTVAEGEERTLELGAPALFTLRGRVAEAGYPLAGARLWLHTGHSRSHRRALLGPRSRDPATRTGTDGRYELSGVLTGEYLLVVRHPTRTMDAEIPLGFEQEATYEYDVDLPITRVSGTVTAAADGRPLEGVDIGILRARDARRLTTHAITLDGSGGDAVTTSTAELERAVRTDASGRYELRGVVAEEDLVVVARGRHIQSTKSGAFRVEVDGVRDGVDLAVRAAGSLRVVVTNADGSPGANVSVHASFRGRGWAQAEVHHELTGPDGHVVLRGLQPGTWRVKIAPRGESDDLDAEPLEPREVEVEARAQATAEFRLGT